MVESKVKGSPVSCREGCSGGSMLGIRLNLHCCLGPVLKTWEISDSEVCYGMPGGHRGTQARIHRPLCLQQKQMSSFQLPLNCFPVQGCSDVGRGGRAWILLCSMATPGWPFKSSDGDEKMKPFNSASSIWAGGGSTMRQLSSSLGTLGF